MKIYMFHYVTENFNYYHFDKNKFEQVVRHLSLTKKIINLKQLKEMQNNGQTISDDYVMLTFDDGTIDHYKYVYPILKKYSVTGLFFICSNVICRNVLNIQIIHKLLSEVDIESLYLDVQKYVLENNISINKNNIADSKLSNWKEIYVKKLIQTILSPNDSERLLENLINKYEISTKFSDYYMSTDNILEMKKNNMEFGCHTVMHKRLAFLNKEEQTKEIRENMQLLYKNNILNKDDVLSIAYPFGNYNNITTNILNDLRFDFAFTTKENDDYEINKYELPRIDCNKLKEE